VPTIARQIGYLYASRLVEPKYDYRISIIAGPVKFIMVSIDSEEALLHKKRVFGFALYEA